MPRKALILQQIQQSFTTAYILSKSPSTYRFEIHDEQDYSRLNDWLISALSDCSIVCLRGDLGAGKTTFIRQFCAKHFGIMDMSSPTYAIINMHQGSRNGHIARIAHVDLYRLKNIEEAMDIGIEELIHSGDPLFIEWPELILPLLDSYIEMVISRIDDDKRRIAITCHTA